MRFMAKAGATISLISGIVVIIGVFLPWMKVGSGWAWSGWDMTTMGYFYIWLQLVAYVHIFAIYIIVGGGLFMAICAIPVWLEAFIPKGGRTYKVMLFLMIFGALVAIGGCIWALFRAINIIDEFSAVGYHASLYYGFYITTAAAVICLISTILTAFSLKENFSRKRQNRNIISYTDKQLQCNDCGKTFTFGAEEQEFFAQRGYTNEPKRCSECRAARKQERGGGRGGFGTRRQMYTVACAGGCGKTTEVPFEPRRDRPVYCSACGRR